MNIVKGVADLFWRTSNPQSAECGSPSQPGRFSPPTPEIIFSDVGDEAILKELLERYTNAVDEVEKRKLFHIFLKQFLTVFRDWKPFNQGTPEEALTDLPTRDDVDVVAGCYFGHPAEIILIFIGEVTYITKLLTDNQGNITTSLNIPNESWMALDALTLVTLSIHNCKVFGYHAGIQKLTALMKVTVVQLKTVTSVLPTDESLSNAMVENAGVLQKILIHVVSIICNFIDFHSSTAENVLIRSTGMDVFAGKSKETYNDPSVAVKSPASDTNLSWHETTVVSVMEAGGLNWLLEILRLIRRLIIKELWPDISLQHMTLRALRSALVDNPRGQNHFRSIGGLEVLLDGLGVPSIDSLVVSDSAHCEERKKNPLQDIFDIHVLSLEVLREAIFGNLNNLQFLCENGRVQKFANSFCSVAFMLQEYKQRKVSSNKDSVNEFEGRKGQASEVFEELAHLLPPFPSDPFYSQSWKDYVARLSEALCYFLLDAKETALCHAVPASSRIATLVPAVYAGLSVKWFTRALLTIFPCIKACSDQEEIPSHLRIFACTMQHYILFAFKKVLLSAPSLIDVFRAEGVWDFIFSENFFYFGPAPAEYFGDNSSRNEVSLVDDGGFYDSSNFEDGPSAKEVEPIQVEVISFMEFAATLSGSSHNLPECTVLVDALEQSVCNPELATALANSLLHILKLSSEKTVSSFKRLAAIPRELKVACILVQESKRPITPVAFAETTTRGVASPQSQGLPYSPVLTEGWGKCIKKFLELFAEYFSASDEAKLSILCSSLCISCIFDLFWEEDLRDLMLTYVFDLMKVVPSSEEDRKAKSFLCSKYLETFTHLKERVKNFADLSIELLVGTREILLTDQKYFQILFRDGECFLHVVSLLNGNLDAENGEKLALNVIQTLTSLLSQNDDSKAAFRALVGKDYQTLRSLLLDFCQWQPSELLLSALLDMLVDGDFDLKVNYAIKNEDAILLYLSVLQKSSDSLQQHGLDMFLQLLRDSLSNQASCVRAGMLDFLLNWFSEENCETIVWKVSWLIQVVGGHSISGKDIRKIFALLRSERAGQQHLRSLLLTSMLAMLNEKGPTAFFDLNGADSGIVIKTPVQWPVNKGFSFTCWLRIESFPQNGPMGLFSFLTENGRGCYAVLGMDKLIYESINQKRQCASMSFNLVRKKWYFFCLVHSVGRAFSGGSQLKCYLDGVLLSSEKCRYPKISEPLTTCTIGTKFKQPMYEDENVMHSVKDALPFCGQIGPTYLFSDAIPAELVRGICSLGPSYMYYFLDNEISAYVDNFLPGGFLDAKDGLASKVIFGLNAQASIGRTLSNVSPIADHANDKRTLEATVLGGTQLCSRRLLQHIIYCVGGVSVFFPLLKQPGMYEKDGSEQNDKMLLPPITLGNLTAEIIKLIASVLDDNLANQQQMLLLSGFSVLGFLLQQAPANQLNLETLSALKHLFGVVSNGGLSGLLVKDAISYVFLNPHIWVHTVYKVQRELYMFLIQQFDNDLRLLKSLCRLPRVLDIIRQFYWGNAETKRAVRSKQALTDQIVGEKPDSEEVHKIRLLLLSLGEMSLREHITASDIKALIAFSEICQDTACIEDILNMIIRAVSDKQLLASFLEQVNIIGGCHIFVNLLSRDFEPVRLLGLQFIGKLLVGLPSEKKVSKFFNIAVGRSKSLSEGHKKVSLVTQTFFSIVSDRIFKYPHTDLLCATLFDVLLGGASPKQVLQKQNRPDRQKNSRNNSEFYLPQILPLIFKYLSGCENRTSRVKIMGDLLDLLDSNPSNIEALMENGWNSWLSVSGKLDVLINYKVKIGTRDDSEIDEQQMVKSIYSLVLSHYVLSVKGGWQNLEETLNFLLIQSEQVGISYQSFVRDIYEDLTQKLINSSAEENIFICQPCRDNTFYLVKLVDEMLISELDNRLPFPACSSKFSSHFPELDNCPDFNDALVEALQGEPANNLPGNYGIHFLNEDEKICDEWWNLYDNLWIIISEMNGKGQSKSLPMASSFLIPSLSQRARGLVESFNIPAAEMAAAVSGGISSALVGKPNKAVDKAMLLRGEKCLRFVNRLMILYLCRTSLERASRCVQQVVPALPFLLTPDDDQSKSRLQLFIWSLHSVRSQYGMLDGGVRIHVISRLIRETINCGKSMLATSIMDSDDLSDLGSTSKEGNSILNFIQKDRFLGAVADEVKYIKSVSVDRNLQLDELRSKMEENMSIESTQKKASEDQIQSSLSAILSSDESRRSFCQLSLDEDQQIVSEKWVHMFRLLIDERGPWSANPFPNSIDAHWKLDKTEDGWRRRQKLRRNYHFDDKLCQPSSTSSNNEELLSANDSKFGSGSVTLEKMKQFSVKGIQRITDEGSSEPNENEDESSQQQIVEIEDTSGRQEVTRESTEQEIMQDREDYPPVTESVTSEVLMEVPCVLVTPRRKLSGRLAIIKKSLHFLAESCVEGTGGSPVQKPEHSGGPQRQKFLKWPTSLNGDIERLGYPENFDIVIGDRCQNQHISIKRHRWWNILDVKAVHWTRFLLRNTAVEIFFVNSIAPIFLNFASQKDAKDVGSLIVKTRNESTLKGYKEKTGVIPFVDRRVAQEMAETAKERWRRREMTNFEYLMILNTLAGRSYNDLTQYPVFPWILADYTSETLDLKQSATFRDLSKPVGALDPKRFEVFEDRYHNFVDPDIPSFYYGSHYSSMGIVLYYLLRLEPFTALHRSLQGGKFDHADRLFHSIESTYRNCLTNTSDVKELIPEFFYMPEFLMNSNSYHFGVKQDGELIRDVCLPPWAKGSAEEFISKNREALESEYVSSNLHNWIDLVFGYKQRGKPAVEAANIFYYLTYEGAVNMDNMEDDLQRSAIEDQIANFGQTPIQIFKKKHPRRGPPIPIAHPLRYAPGSINLTSIVPCSINSSSAVVYINVLDSYIISVDQSLNIYVKTWLTTQLQFGGNFTFSCSQDPFFAVGPDVLPPCKIGSPLTDNFEPGAQCFATLQTPSENFLISCGNWENSFQVLSLNDGRMVQSVRHHKDVISCVSVTDDGSILATGSYDTTVMVWEILRVRSAEKRSRNTRTEFSWKDCIIADTPFHILCGHDDIITCICASNELDLVISGSKDGTCVFHTIQEGRYVRSIRHPSGRPLSKLVASRHGRIVLYADDLSLHLFSINGRHVSTAESNGRLSCIELSSCGNFLVCAGDQGQITVRSMNSLEILVKYTGFGKSINSLYVTPEECFIAGTKDGSLLVYSIENPQLRKASLQTNSKSKTFVT
ncbi:BEACH domain-containing protein B-like isoform X1 [Salvia splendens]|uniref:BEACH domain-containing protein B-like isoform X1 n=1 Tax=Salvia splendens TaxID=180675 RepID=UPI001C2577AA|nr:BEACH domain-containing protein B-like isoform X1 [Salvia splendens]XP_042020552.1 BEACH domain-containing protein B-like isoform X1 [Salvia splendens]